LGAGSRRVIFNPSAEAAGCRFYFFGNFPAARRISSDGTARDARDEARFLISAA
jgi:hypothetical protein